jgi:hypothetical protein
MSPETDPLNSVFTILIEVDWTRGSAGSAPQWQTCRRSRPAGRMEISQSLPTGVYAYLRLKREFMEELQYELLLRSDKLTYDLYFLRYGFWDGVGRPAIL